MPGVGYYSRGAAVGWGGEGGEGGTYTPIGRTFCNLLYGVAL